MKVLLESSVVIKTEILTMEFFWSVLDVVKWGI